MDKVKKLKVTHKFIPNAEFPNRKLTDLTIYTNVDDVSLKKAPKSTLEGMANRLLVESERAEQDAIRKKPPKYDRSYVERATYPLTDLHADFAAIIKHPYSNVTWADYPTERRKWRKCKHKFCLDYFPITKDNFKGKSAKRSDSEYCCGSCQIAANDAEKRFKKHGSYLPVSFYLPRQADSIGDAARATEWATEAESIETEISQNRPKMSVPQAYKNDAYGKVLVFHSLAAARASYVPEKGAKIIS